MKVVDLHAHTTASDGSVAPAALVQRAMSAGLSALAVTDHETVAGLDGAIAEGQAIGMEVVPGMEASFEVDKSDVHILGLLFDHKAPVMTELIKRQSQLRTGRILAIVDRLSEAGINISRSDLERFRVSTGSITRSHLGQILAKRGYGGTARECVDRYLSAGGIGYVPRMSVEISEYISCVHQAGGVAVLAHINQISRADPGRGVAIAESVISEGLDGVETLYCEYDDDWRGRAEALAVQYGLLRSGGSDFHGTFKPGLELGTGYGELRVPYSFLSAMKERAAGYRRRK